MASRTLIEVTQKLNMDIVYNIYGLISTILVSIASILFVGIGAIYVTLFVVVVATHSTLCKNF